MICWNSCFSEPYESAWCTAQKLAWLAASETPTALSAVAGRAVRASPSPRVRSFNDLAWWKAAMSDPAAHAVTDGRTTPQRAVLEGGPESILGPNARTLCAPLLRVCPVCIAAGYHSVVHQLEGLMRCPIDGEMMLTACPQCKKPFGPYVVQRQHGFQCSNCGLSLLRNGHLDIPSERASAKKRLAIALFADWIRRTLPQLHFPLLCNGALGRWEGEQLVTVTLRVARLALLTQIEPCPLESTCLAPGIQELKICASELSSKKASMRTKDADVLAERTVTSVRHWLRREVLREHYACYERVGQYLYGDFHQLALRPQFCQVAYAFVLWMARTNSWLGWVREIARDRESVIALDRRRLQRRLVSDYFFALNGIELTCESWRQGNKNAYDDALELGHLDREYHPWLDLAKDNERVWNMRCCNVMFTRRVADQTPFCDHGEMMAAIWKNMAERIDGLRRKGSSAAQGGAT